jgi:hypothetical protein
MQIVELSVPGLGATWAVSLYCLIPLGMSRVSESYKLRDDINVGTRHVPPP